MRCSCVTRVQDRVYRVCSEHCAVQGKQNPLCTLFLSNCIVGCASDKEDKPTMKQLETDYLLVGAGAFGMAFLDELIHNTKDTTVVVVDKRAKPGGHWNDAYPFVRLHQPAATYGVN